MISEMPIRILLADDHEIVRRGLRAVLEAEADWQVMDEALPELNGLEAARRIRRSHPGVEVLFLTMHESEQMIREGMDAGARGFLLKSDAGHELVPAVRSVSRHKAFFSPTIRAMRMTPSQGTGERVAKRGALPGGLTSRERQVVQLLAEGKSTKEVATVLEITFKTAATHRTNILRKLELHSLAELVRYAIRNSIVAP
jgi:DNA-binding NarL/FixJ family response regulator